MKNLSNKSLKVINCTVWNKRKRSNLDYKNIAQYQIRLIQWSNFCRKYNRDSTIIRYPRAFIWLTICSMAISFVSFLFLFCFSIFTSICFERTQHIIFLYVYVYSVSVEIQFIRYRFSLYFMFLFRFWMWHYKRMKMLKIIYIYTFGKKIFQKNYYKNQAITDAI